MFVIILHITQKRSRLIAIIPFAGVSLMYDIMNLDRFILCAENSADTESHLQ